MYSVRSKNFHRNFNYLSCLQEIIRKPLATPGLSFYALKTNQECFHETSFMTIQFMYSNIDRPYYCAILSISYRDLKNISKPLRASPSEPLFLVSYKTHVRRVRLLCIIIIIIGVHISFISVPCLPVLQSKSISMGVHFHQCEHRLFILVSRSLYLSASGTYSRCLSIHTFYTRNRCYRSNFMLVCQKISNSVDLHIEAISFKHNKQILKWKMQFATSWQFRAQACQKTFGVWPISTHWNFLFWNMIYERG